MLFFFVSGFRRARRAMVRDQGRDEPCQLPFWRLAASEFPLMTSRIGPLRVMTVIAAFFVILLAVEIALNEATPGPFLTPRWRMVVALAGTALFVLAWIVVHAIRSAPSRQQSAANR